LAHATLTTIAALFSGRTWNLDRWFASLDAVEWPKENLHLVAVDNSGNREFSERLLSKLAGCEIRHTYLRDDSRIVDGVPSAVVSDSAEHRRKHVYALGQHLGRLYALAGRYLPADTAHVLSLEDDVEMPPNGLRTLATELFCRQDAGAVCGALASRFGRSNLIAWRDGRAIESLPSSPEPIDATGFYCLLLRRATWERIAWRPGATGTDQWPYYDWAACHDIRAAGETIYLVPVRCRHWQADGSVVDV
jgi:hypothetical protein